MNWGVSHSDSPADQMTATAQTAGVLRSVNVGMPRDIAWQGKTVHTGIWKTPVAGPQTVRRLNIHGDGQGDTAGHGGENRAVFVYQLDSYHYWQDFLGRDDFEYGEFGENFTVTGMADTDVCIGDRFRIGTAEFEVSQPRVTCYRVGIRVGQANMPQLLVAHHRPGFYFRVLTEGVVEAGDAIVKTGAGRHRLSVADVDALLYLPDRDADLLRNALDVPALSPGWQGSFRDLLASGTPSASGPAAPTTLAWNGFRPLRIVTIVDETPVIRSITFADPDGSALPAAAPGQYLTIRLPNATTSPLVRNYSLSSAPAAATYRISVKRERYGAASQWLHGHAKVGDTLDIAAPRGEFTLSTVDAPIVLVSAGVGATPVLAMLYALAETGGTADVWWFHAARRADELAFAAEVRQLISTLPRARCLIRFSGERTTDAAGAVVEPGRLGVADFQDAGVPAEAEAFVCGPIPFMTGMTSALVDAGLSPAHIHQELFGSRAPINPGVTTAGKAAPHLPKGPPGAGPLVTFARSGLTLAFDGQYSNLLELAEACDVPTQWSCRTGVCHTCVTPLITGSVDYAPDPLEKPAPTEALICCSIPNEAIVLDL